MVSCSRCLVLFCALVFVACGSATSGSGAVEPGSGEQTYPVKLERPVAVGDTWRVEAVATDQQTKVTSAAGQVLGQEQSLKRVVLDGQVTVLEVDSQGNAIKARWVLSNLTYETPEGGAQQPFPAGYTFEVHRGADPAFFSGGAPMPEPMEEILSLVISDSPPGESDDLIFGTDQPQPVGASWSINSGLAAADMARSNLQIDPANLTGSTTVAGVVDSGGVPCLDVRATMTARQLALPNMPPGATVDQASMEAMLAGHFPIDPTIPGPLEETSQTEASFRISVPHEGTTISIEAGFHRTQRQRRTY